MGGVALQGATIGAATGGTFGFAALATMDMCAGRVIFEDNDRLCTAAVVVCAGGGAVTGGLSGAVVATVMCCDQKHEAVTDYII